MIQAEGMSPAMAKTTWLPDILLLRHRAPNENIMDHLQAMLSKK